LVFLGPALFVEKYVLVNWWSWLRLVEVGWCTLRWVFFYWNGLKLVGVGWSGFKWIDFFFLFFDMVDGSWL